MKALPYNVDYELIPFAKLNGESAGTWCIKFILGLVKILSLLFLITKITF